MKELENEADLLAPQLRESRIAELRGQLAREKYFSRARKIHRAAEVQECGFAASAAAQQRGHFPRRAFERHATQRLHAALIDFRNVANSDWAQSFYCIIQME